MTVFGGGNGLFQGQEKKVFVSESEFRKAVADHNVRSAIWRPGEISGELKSPPSQPYTLEVGFESGSQAGVDLKNYLQQNDVEVTTKQPSSAPAIFQGVAFILSPFILFAVIYFLFVRPAQAGGNPALTFGRSRAKRVGETGPKITFDDVAGIEEAKQELYEIVDFLKNTKKYVSLGAKIPKGILLTGPPGVGKTHLARAIAGEAGVPFFHISGSDFVEMFVGVGAARVRDLFETAKAHRPCLIFVDEIDAVGRQRGAGLGGGHDEREQTLNQLLVEMDGFDANTGVIMIAATNRPDVLDPALLRPGRFDRQIVVDPPDARGREAILKIHAKGKPLKDVDLSVVGRRTPGFTGADLANMLNEAALLAARKNQTVITPHDLEEAADRVIVGPARKSRQFLAKEREVTAYHEAGHAIIGELLENTDPIHKVTILPRGMALGITWSLPAEDKYSVSKSEMVDDITMMLGGLVAEELVYGERWTGASNDLDNVTRIARAMVCEYGMSDRLGTLSLGRRSRNPFLGKDAYESRDYSEEVARIIDEEIRSIVEHCLGRARQILAENREKMDVLVKVLLERETLNRDEFLAVIRGETLPPLPPIAETLPPPAGPDTDGESGKNSNRVPKPRFDPGPA